MTKQIRQAAIKFYRSLNGKLTSQAVISSLKKEVCDVIFYNTPEGDTALQAYGLLEYSRTVKAFTFCNTVQMIFIDDNLQETDRLRALLHEVGHIKLGHIYIENAHQSDKATFETEANAFMYEVMSPTPIVSCSVAVISTILIIVSFVCGYNFNGIENTSDIFPANSQIQQLAEPTSQTYQVANPVYITRTGSKYHTKDCTHTKDKDCAEIGRAQADILFTPCSVCNP